jgi:hypothetical protein
VRVLSRWRREGLLIAAGALVGAGIAIGVVFAADINGGSSSTARTQENRPLAAALAAPAAPAAPAAQAEDRDCQQWNISTWDSRAIIAQSNAWAVHFDFNQNFSRLQGPARATDPYGRVRYTGNVDGFVSRSELVPGPRGSQAGERGPASVFFTIGWGNGSVGVYSGTITRYGWGDGTTWDLRHPESKATWVLHPFAKCRSS